MNIYCARSLTLYHKLLIVIFFHRGSIVVPGEENGWDVDGLDLQQGLHYSIRVTTVNGAGLAIVHDTTGVIVDPTPPKV